MNLEDFRLKFFAETESLFNRYAKDKVYENENFLNLLALNSCGELYGWFHSYYPPDTFQCICNIFSQLEYDINDDGMVSIFIYTFEHKYCDDIKEFIDDESRITTDFTIIRGEIGYDLKEEMLHKIAREFKFDSPMYKSTEMVSWKLVHFDWDSLKFLASFVPKYKKMNEIAEEESRKPKQADESFRFPGWYEMNEEIKEKILNHFSEKPYMTSEQWAIRKLDF